MEEKRGVMGRESRPRDQFPVGMRVLAVDDDPTCLKVLENLLRKCNYHGLSHLILISLLLLFSFVWIYCL